MENSTSQLAKNEHVIDALVEGIPSALEILHEFKLIARASGKTFPPPLQDTINKLTRGLQAYEVWASNQGAWASR